MLRVLGARDTTNFSASISTGHIPSSDSITFEGIYNEHKFYTGEEKEQILSCNSFSLKSKDPFSDNNEYYISLFLNSKYDGEGIINARIPLNLVICLDISGSMNSSFRSGSQTKIFVAKESLKTLIKQLRDEDSLSIILFNNTAQVLLPFTKCSNFNIPEVFKSIDNLKARGGTCLSAGIEASTNQFINYKVFNGEGGQEGIDLENRIIYLTDMCPNIGSSDGQSLLKLTQTNAENCLYTTFVGLGVDFNSSLVEEVSKTKGCNYLSVKTNEEFSDLMAKDFCYLVYPIAMDIEVSIESSHFDIERIYGSPGFEKPNNNEPDIAVKILSVFPSQKPSTYESEGGVILLKMKPSSEVMGNIRLILTYKSRAGNLVQTYSEILNPFTTSNIDINFEKSIRKTILLTRYVNLMKYWSSGYFDNSDCLETGIPIFDKNNIKSSKQNNKQSVYEIFTQFYDYFTSECKYLEDKSLNDEEKIIQDIINKNN